MENSRFKMDFTRVSNAVTRYCVMHRLPSITNNFNIKDILTRGIGPKGEEFFNKNKEELVKDINAKLEHRRKVGF